MKSIYKYRIEAAEETILVLRGNVLGAGVQGEDIMVWAVHDDVAPEREVYVNAVGTGWKLIPPETSFINTVFLGPFVLHIFATVAT